MMDGRSQPLHGADYLWCRRSASGDDRQPGKSLSLGGRRSGHTDQHGRSTAQMSDPFLADQAEDLWRIDAPQADMRATDRGDTPGEAPAVAVEHGQGPEVATLIVQPDFQSLSQGVEVGPSGMVLNPFRHPGGPGGVVDADGVFFRVELDAMIARRGGSQ